MSIALLIKTYCFFTFVCFEQEITQYDCPKDCQCFLAPLDGIISYNDTRSLICPSLQSLNDSLFSVSDKFSIINTLVLKIKDNNSHFQSNLYEYSKKKIAVRSIIFQGFTGRLQQNDKISPLLPSIFEWFDKYEMWYLSIVEWKNVPSLYDPISFNFYLLKGFYNLQVLQFDKCLLEILDQGFKDIVLPALHSLIITSSSLEYIHRQAFEGKEKQLCKIILKKNKLTNLKWITTVPDTFDQLWYLDLSHNRIRFLPKELISKMPNLRVLYVDHNNFKSFQENSLQKWFKINEFRLAMKSDISTTKESVIYLNQEMKWITEISILSSIQSMYSIDSFLNGFQYCYNDSLYTYQKLMDKIDDIHYRSFVPDQLNINEGQEKGQLEINHCDSDSESKVQMNKPVFLIGLYIKTSLIRISNTFFKSRALLKNSLLNLTTKTKSIKYSIRLPLFDEVMYDHWLNGGKVNFEQINLFIDLVTEYLDLAYLAKQYVLFILWPYQLFSNLTMPMDISLANNFRETIIKPLLMEIRDHPSLIGIEITDSAFKAQIPHSKKCLDPGMDDCPYDEEFLKKIRYEMNFLSYQVNMLRESFGNRLIGIGFDADCRPCMPLLLIDQCLSLRSGFDFLNIQSALNDKNQVYSYHKLKTHYQKWFKQDPRMNSVQKKHLFYSLHEDYDQYSDSILSVSLDNNITETLHKFTMGYFTPSSYDPIDSD